MTNYRSLALVIVCGVCVLMEPGARASVLVPTSRNAALLATSAVVAPTESAKLTFRRIFKSSSPEFIEIVVPEDGRPATYEIRQLDEDPGASPFELSAGLRARMFDLAEKLNRFQGQDLDVHRKIANLGEKTFIWEKGKEVHEVKFNYTL